MTKDPTDLPEITPLELKERLDAGDAPLLVDVREHFEHRIADLPDQGQLRIPAGQLASHADELDRERDVVLYCRSGARAGRAKKKLLEAGYRQVTNLGGLDDWKDCPSG